MFFLLYILPCIIPALVGAFLLRQARTPFLRLLAFLTLKPLLGTFLLLVALWLMPDTIGRGPVPLVILPVLNRPVLLTLRTLLPVPLIGVGLTALVLWYFGPFLRSMPRFTLAGLLVLDTVRWGSTFLTFVLRTSGFDRLALTALTMPTIYASVAWAVWFVFMRMKRQEHPVVPAARP